MTMDVKKAGIGAVLALMVLFVLMATTAHVHPQPDEAAGIPRDSSGDPDPDPPDSTGIALWEDRGMDMIFQMGIILAGAFGVLALVKGVKNRD